MNKEQNFEVAECVEEVVEVCELPETLGSKKIVKNVAVGLGVVAIAGLITVMVRKHKGKLNGLLAKKLRKKGYTVVEPLEGIDCEDETSADVEETK